MRKLSEIIDMARTGELPEYDELRYAICAMDALSTFDSQALTTLALAELNSKKPKLTNSAMFQYEEHFNRNKRALDVDPKTYIGWNNDPHNPEFIERRKAAVKLAEVIHRGGLKA